jgi:signal transduction histidine kinase
MTLLAEAAGELPWLAPCAGSLVALTQPASGPLWPALRGDPGLVLLLLRHCPHTAATSSCSFYPALLREPAVLELALRCLPASTPAFADWHRPGLLPIYRAAVCYATAAEAAALRSDRCDPEHAWVGGLLAPLGWFAAAVHEEAVKPCVEALAPQSIPQDPVGRMLRLQQSTWGLDTQALARRLVSNWRLPAWVAAASGHLGLPLEVAVGLGADPEQFRVLQLAVSMVDSAGLGLHLPVGGSRDASAQALSLGAGDVQVILDYVTQTAATALPPREWQSPGAVCLLPHILRLSLESRGLGSMGANHRLHAELDALHEAIRVQVSAEEKRLEQRKLTALAEVAAGAGHEINNPLAVISGQAQYLLATEQEPARRKALQTIISQSQRIHQTLTQLMQFARPPVPHKQRVDLGGLLQEVIASLQQLADDRQVQLLCMEPKDALTLHVDPGQIRTVLTALLRNAIEAAPPAGWARLQVDAKVGVGLTVVIEDNGPGLSAGEREHMLDPFYSGRKAGRGRGLGLPTAWQLARQHGGDVVLDNSVANTRFVVSLPAESIAEPLPPMEHPGVNACHAAIAAL